jgi:hypothetical protein
VKADVAQLVEQSIRNRQVIGSSPIVGSILLRLFARNRTDFHSLTGKVELMVQQAARASRLIFR